MPMPPVGSDSTQVKDPYVPEEKSRSDLVGCVCNHVHCAGPNGIVGAIPEQALRQQGGARQKRKQYYLAHDDGNLFGYRSLCSWVLVSSVPSCEPSSIIEKFFVGKIVAI